MIEADASGRFRERSTRGGESCGEPEARPVGGDVPTALSVRVRGVVQGVGFRPFVYRLARAKAVAGWVLNDDDGVEIHIEGESVNLDAFVRALRQGGPPAAAISEVEVAPVPAQGLARFEIRDSDRGARPTTRISPDLPTCARCLAEMRDPDDPRSGYLYINCTDCGPRYSIIEGLPYDRERTTMRAWTMDAPCAAEYGDPTGRRFHAQPVACPRCGPHHALRWSAGRDRGAGLSQDPGEDRDADRGEDRGQALDRGSNGEDGSAASGRATDREVVAAAVEAFRAGRILAIKGLGGYHLACDARRPAAIEALRERKFRKEKPFALMVRNLDVARAVANVSTEAEAVLSSAARPITLVPVREEIEGVAPGNPHVGLMLPYAPLHHALFDAGAPGLLVMTSANRSSEPIAFEDDDALERLSGIADAFLIGERPIARRVEDSVVRPGPCASQILRRSRGYAPGAVTALPADRPILALGADLKNTLTLVVGGEAFVSQHIGDLGYAGALEAFRATIRDLLDMYELSVTEALVVADCHPQYLSTLHAMELGAEVRYVQHHRAHIASVLAERDARDARVVGLALDGTGYGDDGAIWGCELFVGSLDEGLARVGGLRRAALVGGDAAASHPVQAAAGFLAQVMDLPELMAPPFGFPERHVQARKILESGTRTFPTHSMGRLFDAAAALLGFVRPITFEGQAAMWLEHLAVRAEGEGSEPRRGQERDDGVEPYAFPYAASELDFRPLLESVIRDRVGGRDRSEISLAFHRGLARGLGEATRQLCDAHDADTVVASGGVMQNALLSRELAAHVGSEGLKLWMNESVPPNDGGISLGQAALASFGRFDEPFPER